jgi:AcrR family transcriptional regulator
VVEIARRAGTSPATFYQYFRDVEEATLELAGAATEGLSEILALLERPLEGAAGLARARALVDRFLALWDAHRAVLRVRNHAAEEGAVPFRRKWRDSLRPLLDALARRLGSEGPARGDGFHPYAAAAALATVLESAGAYHRELEHFGVGREALVETSARILLDTVRASQPRGRVR